MGNDDALYRFRLGVFALAKELGDVRAACRMMGIHHSTMLLFLSKWVLGEPLVVSGGEVVVVVDASFESGDARGVAVGGGGCLSEGGLGVVA